MKYYRIDLIPMSRNWGKKKIKTRRIITCYLLQWMFFADGDYVKLHFILYIFFVDFCRQANKKWKKELNIKMCCWFYFILKLFNIFNSKIAVLQYKWRCRWTNIESLSSFHIFYLSTRCTFKRILWFADRISFISGVSTQSMLHKP